MKISEITPLERGEYEIQDLFGYQQTGVDDRGVARGHFFATGHMPRFARRLLEQGIDLAPRLFEAQQLTNDTVISPISFAPQARNPLMEKMA